MSQLTVRPFCCLSARDARQTAIANAVIGKFALLSCSAPGAGLADCQSLIAVALPFAPMHAHLAQTHRHLFPNSNRQASNQTLPQLLDRNPDLNCSSLAAGDTVCTAGLLGYCGNKVATSTGQTCAAVAAASGLTVNQLLGLNPQLPASGCGDLSGTDVCLPSLPADAVSGVPVGKVL